MRSLSVVKVGKGVAVTRGVDAAENRIEYEMEIFVGAGHGCDPGEPVGLDVRVPRVHGDTEPVGFAFVVFDFCLQDFVPREWTVEAVQFLPKKIVFYRPRIRNAFEGFGDVYEVEREYVWV